MLKVMQIAVVTRQWLSIYNLTLFNSTD